MKAKFAAALFAVFFVGIALGKYSGRTQSSTRPVPAEGLWIDELVVADGPDVTRRIKIATISHETPFGSVRYGHANESDVSENTALITGTFCGDRITAFGFVKQEQVSQPVK